MKNTKKIYLAFSIEESLFQEFKDICYTLGIKHTTAVNLFINKCVELDNLPFSLSETIQSPSHVKENYQMKRVAIMVKDQDGYQKFKEICRRIGIEKARAARIFILRCIDKRGLPFDVN